MHYLYQWYEIFQFVCHLKFLSFYRERQFVFRYQYQAYEVHGIARSVENAQFRARARYEGHGRLYDGNVVRNLCGGATLARRRLGGSRR